MTGPDLTGIFNAMLRLVRTDTGLSMTSRTPPDDSFVVLVVEDEQDHAALLQAAFAYRDLPCALHVTGSSEEAIDYLLGRWPFDNRTRHALPSVIILDLGLPGLGGLDFLRWLETRREPWGMTPVVVFTANTNRALATQAFALGAKEVKIKPTDFGELVDIVEEVLLRWKSNIA
jgi:CheY-like chemotaxis protein